MDDHHRNSANSGGGSKSPSNESSSAELHGNIISNPFHAEGAPLGPDASTQNSNEDGNEAVDPLELPEEASQQIMQSKFDAAALRGVKTKAFPAVEAPSTPTNKRIRENDDMKSPNSALIVNAVKPYFNAAFTDLTQNITDVTKLLKPMEERLNTFPEIIAAQSSTIQGLTEKLEKMEEALNDSREEAAQLREMVTEVNDTTKSTNAGVEEIGCSLKEGHLQGVAVPTAPTYAQMAGQGGFASQPTRTPSAQDLVITLHQVNPRRPVMAGEEDTQLNIKKAMDDQIGLTIGSQLDIGENFITAAKRLPTHTIKLHAQNETVAKRLRETDVWVPNGLRLHALTYEVAVLRVPVLRDQGPQDIADNLMQQNDFIIKDQVVYAKWAKRQATKQKYATLKIQLKDESAAKFAVSLGLSLDAEKLLVEPANRIPRQCRKCGKVRHTQRVCRSEAFCFICGGRHEYTDCKEKCNKDLREDSGLRRHPGAPPIFCSGTEKCTHYARKFCSNCPEALREGHTAFDTECPTKKTYLEQIEQQSQLYRAQLLGVSPREGYNGYGRNGGSGSEFHSVSPQ